MSHPKGISFRANIEQGMSNFEVFPFTSAVRDSVFDILRFTFKVIAYGNVTD